VASEVVEAAYVARRAGNRDEARAARRKKFSVLATAHEAPALGNQPMDLTIDLA